MYLDETACEYRYSTNIITAFNADAYDFDDIISTEEIKDIINRNLSEQE